MGERTTYEPGTPSWVDVTTPDPAAAMAFYGALLGWQGEQDPRPEAGGYGLFRLGGKTVAGFGPAMGADVPPSWTVYVTVADAAATVQTAEEAGGSVLMAPMAILDAGTMAMVADPTGTPIALWQADAHIGCEQVNDPGCFVWNELASSDLAAAREFYGRVFGWVEDPEGSNEEAALFTLGGRVTCGAHAAGEGEPPYWSVWFSVADCDATAAKAVELGGAIVVPPGDMDFGRGAVLADPAGAVFGIGKVTQVDD